MIMAVVSAAAAMQAAGSLDFMIKVATKILRRNPKHIMFIAPLVTYLIYGIGRNRACGVFNFTCDCGG